MTWHRHTLYRLQRLSQKHSANAADHEGVNQNNNKKMREIKKKIMTLMEDIRDGIFGVQKG